MAIMNVATIVKRRTMKMKMKMNDEIEENPEIAKNLSIQEAFEIFIGKIKGIEIENQRPKKKEGFKE
jgi:hypothetical protein